MNSLFELALWKLDRILFDMNAEAGRSRVEVAYYYYCCCCCYYYYYYYYYLSRTV